MHLHVEFPRHPDVKVVTRARVVHRQCEVAGESRVSTRLLERYPCLAPAATAQSRVHEHLGFVPTSDVDLTTGFEIDVQSSTRTDRRRQCQRRIEVLDC